MTNKSYGNVYMALIHHPIKNKWGEKITTSVTNMDIHDISRSAKTYGVKRYFIVTPLAIQHDLVNKILGHWQEDINHAYNPDRSNALEVAKLAPDFSSVLAEISSLEAGALPIVVSTGANFEEGHIEVQELQQIMQGEPKRPVLLLFGTGHGLHEEILDHSDYKLAPLKGPTDYNHLSVRSAVAIYLDKLLGHSAWI